MIDLSVTRFLQGKANYRLEGSCNGCGACCVTPMIQVYPPLFYFRTVRWLVIKWHESINGFAYIDANRREKTLIFRCTHYDPETRQCDSYDSRPGLCRDYPRNLTYMPNPELLEDCSYRLVYKNADALLEALEEEDLPPEKMAEIKKKLHLQSHDEEDA